jgi:hypothetical protein
VKYPALIVQLLRVRFPSPEPDVCLTDCVSYSIEDFIKYTSSWLTPYLWSRRDQLVRWGQIERSCRYWTKWFFFCRMDRYVKIHSDAHTRVSLQNEKRSFPVLLFDMIDGRIRHAFFDHFHRMKKIWFFAFTVPRSKIVKYREQWVRLDRSIEPLMSHRY